MKFKIKPLINIITLLTLITTITTNCSDGCLKCGNDKKCHFCDFQNGYYLKNNKNGTCEKLVTENCKDFNINGNCSLCKKDYHVDGITKKCVKVETLIENCDFYDSALQCNTCKKEHYVLNGKCFKLENEINNCIFYFDKERCKECVTDFELTSDYKKCEKSPDMRNCDVYSNLNCKACSQGFLENKNYYFDHFFSFQNKISIVEYIHNSKNAGGSLMIPNKCQKIQNENCLESETYNHCKKCLKGYYLNEFKKCIINPTPKIDNCEFYSTKNKCSKCLTGFYLKTTQICEIIILIENCLTYHLSEKSNCLSCNPTHFLDNNKCTLRTKTVEGCVTYNKNLDICTSCQAGNVLTSDGLKCFTNKNNCTHYNNSTFQDTNFVCNNCENGFYLDSNTNTCLSGGVNKCERYGNSSTNCLKCENTFYLDSSLCKLHKSIVGCKIYDYTSKDKCTTCDTNHFLFDRLNFCIPVVPIANCVTYSKTDECSACEDNFFLANSNKTCDSIPIEENCLQKDTNSNCVKCKPGYFISNNVCKTYKEFQKLNCAVITNDGSNQNDLNCEKCLPLFFSFNYKDHYSCVLNQRLIDDGIKINNCIKHKTIGATTKCTECETGFFVTSTGTCDNCSSGLKYDYDYDLDSDEQNNPLYAKKISNLKKNQCKTADTKCASKTRTLFGDETCLSCNSGYVGTVDNIDKKTLVNPKLPWDTTKKSLGQTFYGVNCNQKLGTPRYYPGITVNGVVNAGPHPDCESYKDSKEYVDHIGNPNSIFYCNKCAFRKTGKVQKYTFDIQSNNTNTVTYLNCSSEVIGCEEDYFGGFHFDNWANIQSIDSLKMFTCHNCADPNHIVFHYSKGDVYEEFGTDENAMKANESINKNGKVVACHPPTADGLGFKAENFTATFTPNCQLAQFDVNKTKEFKTTTNSSDIPIRCIECKPGFRKVIHDNKVLGCNLIENCNNNTDEKWLNSCSECMNGYSWKYDDTKKSTFFDICISNKNQKGCMAYSETALKNTSPSRNCKYCKKGYIFNKDGLCEIIRAPKCDDNYFVNLYSENLKVWTNNNRTAYNFYHESYIIEYLLPNTIGCTKCNQDYLPHSISENQFACTKSPYLEAQSFILNTNFITNCEEYSGNSSICRKCKNNFIPTVDNLNCVPMKSYPNCVTVKNSKISCQTCDSTTFLRKDKCELRLIPECKDYIVDSPDMKCETCMPGFYTGSDKYSCVLGKLSNCVLYDNTGKCTKCSDKFGLVNVSNNKSYCLELRDNLYCNQVNSSKLSNHQYECNQCLKNYIKTTDFSLFDRTDCFKITEIQNCQNHNLKNNLISSTLKCDKCNDNFFVTENGLECKIRTYTTAECEIHSDNSETCNVCKNGFYKSDDLKKCISSPKGIKYCKEYKSETECSRCDDSHFVRNKICEKVADDKLIVNCIEYEEEKNENEINTPAPTPEPTPEPETETPPTTTPPTTTPPTTTPPTTTPPTTTPPAETVTSPAPTRTANLATETQKIFCKRCDTNFIKSENNLLCEKPIARNCALFKNLKTCEKCPEGYVFSINKDILVTECIMHGIQNCNKLNPTTKECIKCNNGYYVNSSKSCSKIPIDIEGCLFYETKETCSKCEIGKVLAVDKKSCFIKGLNNTNPMNNCDDIEEINKLICVTCKEGFFFNGGQCEKCTTSLEQGCYACDYNDSSKCLLCTNGYHQEEEFKPCVRNSDNKAPEVPENTVLENKTVEIVKCLIMIFAFVLF